MTGVYGGLWIFTAGVIGGLVEEDRSHLYAFTSADVRFLSVFSLSTLPPPPPSASNRHADDLGAAALGHRLFFERRLSRNGHVACATCHQPERYFTDGLPVSLGLGTTARSAPSVVTAVHSPWQYWDGRKDSLWAQALGPLEHPHEQGLSRLEVVQVVVGHYLPEYVAVFGDEGDLEGLLEAKGPASPLGDAATQARWRALSNREQHQINRAFSNVGKALMAYQRRLQLLPARFDQFVAALIADAPPSRLKALLSTDEVAGLRLFMGQGNCASCHNGPLFTNFEFHNVGAPEPEPEAVDLGRYGGIPQLLTDEFTCLSVWSDADPSECAEMRFLKRQGPELVGAYKTPTLRNIAATAPYMQSGQLTTLEAVVAHYNRPRPPFYDPRQHPNRPHFDILPLGLTTEQQHQLVAFLGTLTSPVPGGDSWWFAPEQVP